ncbi:UNVERIFIED_CONTAM: L-threonate dehydrogenase [Sesamum calycinum]|uniref:L-threonate dehydrogenase n=1 Tax=Sesamum calycinum TaxID=2727403 RepID=A0AAW2NE85_9LAMI
MFAVQMENLFSDVSRGWQTGAMRTAVLIEVVQNEQKNLKLVDAPVSGGVKRAADGTLTIMASGADEALEHAGQVLSALSEKLYIINGGCGAGSRGIAFGARLGLNTRLLFDVITNSAGTSWMFENRGPHMVESDYTPLSALDIFVKDLEVSSGKVEEVKRRHATKGSKRWRRTTGFQVARAQLGFQVVNAARVLAMSFGSVI